MRFLKSICELYVYKFSYRNISLTKTTGLICSLTFSFGFLHCFIYRLAWFQEVTGRRSGGHTVDPEHEKAD
jgi:hypothetical protein